MKKLLLAAILTSGLLLTLAPTAHATNKDNSSKGFVCHATGSESNPYVLLYVSLNSAHFDAEKHPDDIFFENTNKVPTCPGDEPKDGEDGSDGKDGNDGEDGTNGSDGEDGLDGKDGAQGPAGPQGPAGADADVQAELANLRLVVTELNNRLFILEHTAPAPVEPAADPEVASPTTTTTAPPQPISELPKTGSPWLPILLVVAGAAIVGGIGLRLLK